MPTLEIPQTGLDSPAQRLSQRNRWETDLTRLMTRSVQKFLRATIRQFQTDPRTGQAQIEELYRQAIDDVLEQYDGDDMAIEMLKTELFQDNLAEEVWSTAMMTLHSNPGDYDALKEVLAFDTPSAVTAGAFSNLLGIKSEGMSWRARVRSRARSTATRINSNVTMLQLKTTVGNSHKRWVSRQDGSVRDTHREVDGQIVPLNSTFFVGGFPLQYPGDRAAPIGEWVNCRCVIVGATR